jgi:hypothetical protein
LSVRADIFSLSLYHVDGVSSGFFGCRWQGAKTGYIQLTYGICEVHLDAVCVFNGACGEKGRREVSDGTKIREKGIGAYTLITSVWSGRVWSRMVSSVSRRTLSLIRERSNALGEVTQLCQRWRCWPW